jgi:hypothetical protein
MSAPASSARMWEAEDYLAAVGRQLADLPAEERSALLEDLALHLESLGAEDDDRSIAVRLGPADAYAAELRAAAGLPARAERPRLVGDGLRQRVGTALGHPWVGEVRRLLTELRPAWWVLRGYLLVLVPCLAPFDAARDFPVPAPLGSHALGVVLVLVAVVGSVALGRQRLPRLLGALVVVGGAALALGALLLWQSAAKDGLTRVSSPAAWVPMDTALQAEGRYPLLSRYGPVTDVLPYAADGTPLTGVLLFDQDGRPLHVGRQEWWADGCARVLQQPLAADGVPVPFSFPQGYVLDPAGVDRYGWPVSAGQCTAELPRPEVPLPVFPAPTAGG